MSQEDFLARESFPLRKEEVIAEAPEIGISRNHYESNPNAVHIACQSLDFSKKNAMISEFCFWPYRPMVRSYPSAEKRIG